MISYTYKQRLLLLLLSAIFLSTAWISRGFSLFIAFVPLFFVEDYYYQNKEKYKSTVIFRLSYLLFILWHVAIDWWVSNASLGGGMMVILLNSFFYAFIFWLFHWVKRQAGSSAGYASFVVIWIAFEYIHTFWELSWPWMTLGNWLGKSIYFIQWYEFTGVEGGSLWIILINLLIFALVKFTVNKQKTRPYYVALIGLAILILIPSMLSILMYVNYKETGKDVDVVVIQPNIDPYHEKYDKELYQKQLENIIALSDSLGDENVDFYVGPETAFPRGAWESQLKSNKTVKTIRNFLKKSPKAKYIIGLSSYKLYNENDKIPATARSLRGTKVRYYDRYNSAILIDSTQNLSLYHKSKFVIGVEKMPFLHYIPALEKLAMDFGGIVGSLGADKERKTFNSYDNQFRVGPIICYESVYGEFVTEYVKKGANLLFVITNDGWWGNTAGHRMHLMHSQLRAIETRRSFARSANTGVSAFVNQRGELSQATNYWERDVIRQKIKTNEKITFYVKYGDIIGRISLFLAVLMLIYALVKAIVPDDK